MRKMRRKENDRQGNDRKEGIVEATENVVLQKTTVAPDGNDTVIVDFEDKR